MWIDVTWGAGGSTADKTLEICIEALKHRGLNVMMHLTCTNMPKEELKKALETCKENGIRNILALRGDPPGHLEKGDQSEGFKQCEGGFAYATDLVKYIRATAQLPRFRMAFIFASHAQPCCIYLSS